MAQALQESGSASVQAYLHQWLLHAKTRVRPRTYQGYEGLIRLYAIPEIGKVGLGELHPLHLQSLYASLMSEKVPPISASSGAHPGLRPSGAVGNP